MHTKPLRWLCAALSLGLLSLPGVAQPPAQVRDLVMGLRVLASEALDLGVEARALRDASGVPFFIWREGDVRELAVPRDRAQAAAWLTTHARALGHGTLQARFADASTWRGLEVWAFTLTHDGVPMHDAQARLYWGDEGCLGILNRCPRLGPLPDVSAVKNDPTARIYVDPAGGAPVVAHLRTTTDAKHRKHELFAGGRAVHTVFEQLAWDPAPQAAVITEYTFAGMNFPDQIWADARGRIWFSEPPGNRVTVFDPNTLAFTSYPTRVGTTVYGQPDGLAVDDQDRVWTGLYTSTHGLGVHDVTTGVFTRYAAPYPNAAMAIPTPTMHGTIYVTDHANNRISELDPVTGTWVRSEVLAAGTYPVGGMIEPETGDAWFTLYTFNGLGKLSPGKPIVQIPTPSRTGPAFAGVHDGKIYYTYWSENKLGEYDTRSGTFVEYLWRTGELGGPMAMAPNGHVIVGTRSAGYIAVFDPLTKTFTDHKIPTASPGLKDGLTVAPDGTIWFTESGRNKIAKLVLP